MRRTDADEGAPWLAAAPAACEVAVVGAGPAGSAVAALLARAGRDVVLVERDRFPRDKLCGEFLSWEAPALLRELGCLDAVLALEPPEIRRARFTAPSGRAIEFELPGVGLGVSRCALDALLLERATACGARALTGIEVRAVGGAERGAALLELREPGRRDGARCSQLAARGVVLASGRSSRLDGALGSRSRRDRADFVGYKRHCVARDDAAGRELAAALDGVVEVHAVAGGYCGLSCVEGGRVNVCALLHRRVVRGLDGRDWDGVSRWLARANRALGRRLGALEPADDVVHVVGDVSVTRRPRSRGGLVFVGDAAGMIAPFSGDGQASALRSAALLAKAFASAGRPLDSAAMARVAAAWDRAWRRELRGSVTLARGLQACLLSPLLAEAVVAVLARVPALATGLARATRSPGPDPDRG